jgi:hypothetical protein
MVDSCRVVHVGASVYLHVQQLEVLARAGRLDEARLVFERC